MVETTVSKEKEIQNFLQKAKDNYISDEIVGLKILKCKYKTNGILYNGTYYHIKPHDYYLEKDISKNEIVYLPVFILNYNGVQKCFTNGWFKEEHKAKSEIKKLEKHTDSFRFHINSNDKIIHNTTGRKIYERIKNNKYITTMNIMLTYLIVSIPLYIGIGVLFQSPFYLLISFVVLTSSIFHLCDKLNNINYDSFEKYRYVDIPTNKIYEGDTIDVVETEYKSINCNVQVKDSGLKIISKELNTEWFYERNKNTESLSENGVKLLNELPIEKNKCALTVTNKGNTDSPWLSEDGQWWIDVELIFK